MKLSKTFGENLKSLSVVATSLRPGPITQGIQAIVDGLKKIGAVDVRPTLKRNETAFAEFVTKSKPVKGAFLSLGTQVGHTSKTIDDAKEKWRGMADTLKDSKNNAKDLETTLADIKRNLNTMGTAVKNATKALGPDLKKALAQNAESAKAIQPTFSKVADAVNKSADKVKESVDNWKSFGDAMSSTKDNGNDLAGAMDKVQGSTDHVRDAMKKIIDSFKVLKITIRDVFKDSKQWFANLGQQMMHGLVDGIKSGVDGVVAVLDRVGKAMTDLANTYKESMADMAATSNTMLNLLDLGGGGGNKKMSLAGAAGRGGGQILQVTTPIQIDGKTLATVVTKYQLKGARGTGNVSGRYAGGNQTGGATGLNPNNVNR
jgi:methyl-accepting chemotaxis protein